MQFLLLLLAAIYAAAPSHAETRPEAIAQVNALCGEGKAEGSYHVSLGSSGSLDLHLLCTPEGDMLATGFVGSDGESFSLPHWALDGDKLTFIGFNPAREEARNMGGYGGPEVRVRLSYAGLQHSELHGTYQGAMSPFPMAIATKRAKAFPACGTIGASTAFDQEGYYVVESGPKGSHLKAGAVIGVEVIGGLQRIYVISPGDFGMGLYNGLEAATAGNSFCANLGIDDDQHGRGPMVGVRGAMVGEDRISFYYFSSRHGMQGPFLAKRH